MSKEKGEIIERLRAELPYLKREFNGRRIGLFGSTVKGTEKSDVDILVEFEEPIGLFTFMELELHRSEANTNTIERIFSLLKSWLRIFRGVRKDNLWKYLKIFESDFNHRNLNPFQKLTNLSAP